MSERRSDYFGTGSSSFGSDNNSFGLNQTNYNEERPRRPFTVAEAPQKIQLNRQRQPGSQNYGRQAPSSITVSKSSAADKMSLILGGLYSIGAGYGVIRTMWDKLTEKTTHKRRYVIGAKVKLSRQLTEGFKKVSYYGNNIAAAGLMYVLFSKIINYLFQEELEYVPKLAQYATFGFITGFMCKLINGYKPALLGGTIGLITAPIVVGGFSRISSHIII